MRSPAATHLDRRSFLKASVSAAGALLISIPLPPRSSLAARTVGASPSWCVYLTLHPDNTAPKGLNGARYNNPEVTKNLEAARGEPDFNKRKALYAQVQKQALTDLPYLPTGSGGVFWPGRKWVTGVKINPLAQVGFYGVKLLAH